jgi:hypothetical protein
MGGLIKQTFLRLSLASRPRPVLPTHGILKGGAYGSQEEGKKEGKKEEEVNYQR